jgi:hypothetical protein
MDTLWITWAICAVLILAVQGWVGHATRWSIFGLLIDTRGRYSLTRLQLSLWTLVVVSLIAAVFGARATTKGIDPMAFSIPASVLGVLGISVGSAVTSIGIKASKDRTRTKFIKASKPGGAFFAQMLLVEEGPEADQALLGISHAGYLIAKAPNRGEDPTQDVPDFPSPI